MKDIFVKDGSLYLVPNSVQCADKIVTNIKNLIHKTNVTKITINLSEINMFSALKIAALTSAMGLTENISKHFEIIVDNEITKEQIKLLSLSNMTISLSSSEKVTKELVAVKI